MIGIPRQGFKTNRSLGQSPARGNGTTPVALSGPPPVLRVAILALPQAGTCERRIAERPSNDLLSPDITPRGAVPRIEKRGARETPSHPNPTFRSCPVSSHASLSATQQNETSVRRRFPQTGFATASGHPRSQDGKSPIHRPAPAASHAAHRWLPSNEMRRL